MFTLLLPFILFLSKHQATQKHKDISNIQNPGTHAYSEVCARETNFRAKEFSTGVQCTSNLHTIDSCPILSIYGLLCSARVLKAPLGAFLSITKYGPVNPGHCRALTGCMLRLWLNATLHVSRKNFPQHKDNDIYKNNEFDWQFPYQRLVWPFLSPI